jgi:hypothetical protein
LHERSGLKLLLSEHNLDRTRVNDAAAFEANLYRASISRLTTLTPPTHGSRMIDWIKSSGVLKVDSHIFVSGNNSMRAISTAAFLLGVSLWSQADAQGFRQPCHVETLCPGVQRGGGQIVACLKTHRADLSEQCYAALGRFMINRSGNSNGASAAGRGMGPAGGEPDGAAPDPTLQ